MRPEQVLRINRQRDAERYENMLAERAALEDEAHLAADLAQASIGEAYRSPFTRQTALEAARIALGITTTQPQEQGEQ